MPYSIRALAIVALVLPLTVRAELLDRGRGLIYDSATNLTWQQDANLATTNTFTVSGINADGSMSWHTAMKWVAAMNGARYLGFDDWHLPTNKEADLSCGPILLGYQYNCAKVELGSIFFTALGNKSSYSSTGVFQPGYGLANTGPFQNLSAKSYWTSTEWSSDPVTTAYRFDFAVGGVDESDKNFTFPRAWAVRDGDVSVLTKFALKSAIIAGCKSVTGTLTLSEAAPSGGLLVTLADTLTAATTPSSVTIAAGARTRTFTITTTPVTTMAVGTVSATLNGQTLSQPLTVRPMGLSSISLAPTTVVGSKPVVGKATLECLAGPGPVTVDLSSSNAAVANPIATSIVVPQALQSAPFDVTTNRVLSKTTVTISGTANDIKKSTVLTVTPAAAVSPTSLKFANQKVGTTSASLNVTLSNKGAIAFTVTSIGITGTNASSFIQSNSCPSTLSAGASCVIGVRFKPTAMGSKTAKVTIATTATSTALSVSLSGTAVSP